MSNRPESSKLSELREKTNRQLLEFLIRRLDTGLNFARLAADPESRSVWASTSEFHAGAEKAYAEVRALLPCLQGVSKFEHCRVEVKLELLGELLGQLSVAQRLRAHAAC